ncbi:hypothetical protein [Streptacidiphilus sp. PAMC 29251]
MNGRRAAGQPRSAAGPGRMVLRAVRADPHHAPESVARYAVQALAPRADSAVAALRQAHPEDSDEELRRRVADRGVRTTIVEGSFLGGPFMLLWPPAFCAALVAQLHMTLTLAALSGQRADDDSLTADLLVLQGASPTPAAARRSLAAAGSAATGPDDRAERAPGWWDTGRRLAHLIGLFEPDDGRTRSRARQAAGWAGLVLLCVVGFAVPLVWLPASAEMYRRATGRLAARTLAYYRPADGPGAPAHSGSHRWTLRPGAVAVATRALFSVLLTAAVLLAVVFADLRLASSHVLAALLLLLATSAACYALLRARRSRRSR